MCGWAYSIEMQASRRVLDPIRDVFSYKFEPVLGSYSKFRIEPHGYRGDS